MYGDKTDNEKWKENKVNDEKQKRNEKDNKKQKGNGKDDGKYEEMKWMKKGTKRIMKIRKNDEK
jgi:hypothetical protein